MHPLSLAVSCILAALAAAQVVDETTCAAAGKYTADAVACSNMVDDAVCTKFYPTVGTTQLPAAVAGDPKTRIFLCASGGAAATPSDPLYVAMSVRNCAKHCGLCCITPEYSCDNSPQPRVDCDTVTPGMCKDPKWRQIIASDCPKPCGFCTMGGCIDAAVDCKSSMCKNVDLQDFVKENCKRTCNFCGAGPSPGNPTTKGPVNNCFDRHPNCGAWNGNGFCNSAAYTAQQKNMYCAKTCNICPVV